MENAATVYQIERRRSVDDLRTEISVTSQLGYCRCTREVGYKLLL